ncbi:MAG TPA: DUF6285 domain-containing protein [Phototrophicaceae bacterium]|nr:DUF6285 domain-containing protein [Phototrophicaceae bacterium]
MYDQPTLIELLNVVRVHLKDQIIPLLAEDNKLYPQTLAAINALRIAERELILTTEHMQAEWQRLNFVQQVKTALPAAAETTREALTERNHKLCAQIAAGEFDAFPQKAALFEHLLATTTEQVQVANPRFLQLLAREDAERERKR